MIQQQWAPCDNSRRSVFVLRCWPHQPLHPFMPAAWCLKAQVCRLGLRIRETNPKEPNSLQTERLLYLSNTTWRCHFCACYEKRRPIIYSSGRKLFQIVSIETSLTVQWLSLQASLQGARVWSLVGELWSHMQRGVAKTKSINIWA